MTLSQDILARVIAEAAPEANTVNKILEITDLSSNDAQFATGVESMARLAKNLLGALATQTIEGLRTDLYGSGIPTFTEITNDTAGIGLVPIGTPGSPQPLLEGILLSFGAAGNKVQLLIFNSLTIWFRVYTGHALARGFWKKINAGILDHRFYYHDDNNADNPTAQTKYYAIPGAAASVLVRLRGAGGGGGGTTSFENAEEVNRGNPAGQSAVRHLVFLTINPSLETPGNFSIRAAGGLAGNGGPSPTYFRQRILGQARGRGEPLFYIHEDRTRGPYIGPGATGIPDAPRYSGGHNAPFTIAGLGEPGGVSEKRFLYNRGSTSGDNAGQTRAAPIPQDGLAGELTIGSFDPFNRDNVSNGRLEITLAPGGRHHSIGHGYHGKGASVEIIVW